MPLSEEAAAFFEEQTAGKSGQAPIFIRRDGQPWARNAQWLPMRAACERARIDPPASFHMLRHAVAAHLIQNGASLQLAARMLGHANSRMTEQHYAHLAPSFEDQQIRAAAFRLGMASDGKVRPAARAARRRV